MTTPRAESGELIEIHPYGDRLEQTTSATLVKTDELEVIRMVLPAGKKIPRHQAASAITVQCLEGAIEFESHGRTQLMRPGTMLFGARRATCARSAGELVGPGHTRLGRSQ